MQRMEAAIESEYADRWKEMPVVLSVDDDHRLLFLYWQSFAHQGFRCVPCATGEAAMAALQMLPVSLVTMDYDMPGRNGAELAQEIRRLRPEVPIVLVSGTMMDGREIAGCFDRVHTKGGSLWKLFASMHELLKPGRNGREGVAA